MPRESHGGKTASAGKRPALTRFFDLVRRIQKGLTARSENDLSRHLADVFEELHLSAVVDTSPRGPGRQRPDILAYRSAEDADLVLPADVVVEAKLPSELESYPNLGAAVVGGLWEGKTLPYILKNLPRIRYYILTSFTDYACLRITPALRTAFAEVARSRDTRRIAELQQNVLAATQLLPLTDTDSGSAQAIAFTGWLDEHLSPAALADLPLSHVRGTVSVVDRDDLEEFASRLAELMAGPPAARAPRHPPEGDSSAPC